MLASKVYESFVLEWTLEQVKLKDNQFGGSKGCGAPHLLISVWQNILQDLEDCRAGTLLTAIDYAKAFNRMQFQECLRALVRHGASVEIVRLIAMFLTDRHMSVRVGSSWSATRRVNGGVPQGSILGVLLFNITTDNLEDSEDAIGLPSTEGVEGPPLTSSSSSEDSVISADWAEDFAHSTPSTVEVDFEPNVTPFRRGTEGFVFLDKARNVRRALETNNITMLRDKTIPDEPNPVTSVHKYIDDSLSDSKLDFENVLLKNGQKLKHAVGAQNVFRRTIRNAELIGMKANTEKTRLLCVSDAISFKAGAFFYSIEGTKLTSGDELKLLGFRFGSRPTCHNHIEAVRKSLRGRYWLLMHMKQHFYTEEELVKAYAYKQLP